MDLRQIAEALHVPLPFLSGRKERPKLRLVPKVPVDKPKKGG